ncbi:MAG: tol-pal system-associated acyl-CoA thioesterase, partial [Pseudomonadota bacterium]|nr:tol-pal system-associated acyl-CoA thioesterase [Pseudomonadota bacterium]
DLNIRYRKAAVLDDEIVATTDLAEITKAGMTLNQTVIRRSESAEKTEERTEELLVDAQVRVACINNEGRPAAIPADIVALMKT